MNIFWQNFIVYGIVAVSSVALIFHYWKSNMKKTKACNNDCGCDIKKQLKRSKSI